MSKDIYRPSHVANYFLSRANKEDVVITQLKLLKLVYIGYGWVQAVLDRPLFDEGIEAWKHGPVVPSLYNEFKHFGRDPIIAMATEFNLDSQELKVPEIPVEDEYAYMVLGKVWDVYHQFSAWSLRDKTHEPNTPWTTTFNNGSGLGEEIPPELIKEHFRTRITEYIAAAE